MPLYMDIHYVGEISVEDTREAHIKDLEVQEKYGVTYHQYWYNEEAGTVFCLMEGPDKESCAATHREANGFTACQIVEVEGGLYDLFMGENLKVDHGLVRRKDGNLDSGYRFILTLDMIAKIESSNSVDLSQLKLPGRQKNRILQIIAEFNGREVRTGELDGIIAVFETPDMILKSIHSIKNEFLSYGKNQSSDTDDIVLSMGISVGQPLTEKDGFFVKGILMSQRLCQVACDNEIISSSLFEDLCDINKVVKQYINLRIIKPSEQVFLDDLLDIIENKISDYSFGVNYLSHHMGVSQPQLYRKVKAITGRSPVVFIRDMRLNKALFLIKENKYNLSEIALEIGYNSPSYFSKCFQDKFGIKPSKITI